MDGNGVYFSRAASAGPFVFLASVSVNERGEFDPEARVEPPYHLSHSAVVRAQTNCIFRKYKSILNQFGSSIDDIVQVEQHIPLKAYADAYLEASRSPEFMRRKRPGSALIETGDLIPSNCVINPTAIAVIPGAKMKKEIVNPNILLPSKDEKFGPSYAEEPPYNELVRAGNFFFTVGDVACDFKTGIQPEVRVVDYMWWGNEIRNEVNFILKVMESRLKTIGASLDDMVHCSVFMPDISDLYEADLVWKQYFPKDPPARFVTPTRGLGVPRKENAIGHAEGAVRIETMFRGIIPGGDIKKEVIRTSKSSLGHESVAVKAGPTLWISGQLAGDSSGLVTSQDPQAQTEYILQNIGSICSAAGTSIHNVVRLAVSATSKEAGYAVFKALKSAIPSSPPTVVLTIVPGPLQVPGCSVLVGSTVYVPE